MSAIIQAIIECIQGPSDSRTSLISVSDCEAERAANNIADALFTTSKDGKDLEKELDEIVGIYGWTEKIALHLWNSLAKALSQGASMGPTMTKAFDDAVAAAADFARDHPAYCAILALGVLVALAPWIIEALGFAEVGIVEDSLAAAWQAKYAGYVPKGSLFSFFQRLGMVWRRKIHVSASVSRDISSF
ncbi:hypothetical protein PVAG01_08950 [Phlyctema vagabunda]|uniref:Uncharacterized protein n=1 Tax=Phlyctema vagabunda TaxID=108571 RepID=A0ABR4PAU9_9HELO